MSQCKAERKTPSGMILYCLQDVETHDPSFHIDSAGQQWPTQETDPE
jgi:hypothetical protein